MSSEDWQSATRHKTRKVDADKDKCMKPQHDTTKSRSFSRGWSKPSIPQTTNTLDDQILDMSMIEKEENHALSQFHTNFKKPLLNLLSDYGEQDPDYDKIKTSNTDDDKSRGMLSSRGKAPIHIKVLSFGFTYNLPKQSREGFSCYSNPIPVIDCREFIPCIPPYLERFNGFSHQVKRAVLQSCSDNSPMIHQEEEDYTFKSKQNILRRKVNTTSVLIIQSLHDAISSGGHGYAFPLEMTIYVGSEHGSHRSVVCGELLGQSLRASLRSNKDGKITQPISVEIVHRDIDKRRIFQQGKHNEDPNDPKRKKRIDPSLEDW